MGELLVAHNFYPPEGIDLRVGGIILVQLVVVINALRAEGLSTVQTAAVVSEEFFLVFGAGVWGCRSHFSLVIDYFQIISQL